MFASLAFVRRRPLLFASLVTLGFLLVIAAGSRMGGSRDDAMGMLIEGLTRVILAGLACGVAAALGWAPLGFAAPRGGRAWALFLPPLVYLATVYPLLFTGSLAPNLARPQVTALVAAGSFAAGLAEDLVFRGLVFFGLLAAWEGRRDAVGRAAVMSAVLFSLPHVLNLLAGHQPLRVSAQILWAFVLGMSFAYLAGVVKSAWPSAVLHGVVDAIVATNRMGITILLSPVKAIVMVLASVPVLVYALALARRRSP